MLLNLNEDKSNAHMCTVRIDNVGRGIERERERERKQSLGDRTFLLIFATRNFLLYTSHRHTHTHANDINTLLTHIPS